MRRKRFIANRGPTSDSVVITVLSDINFLQQMFKFRRYNNVTVDLWPYFYCTRVEMAISEL